MTAPFEPESPPAGGPYIGPLPPGKGGVFGWLKRHGKWLLFAVGIVAIGMFIRETGPAKVGAALLGAKGHLPFIVLLEACWISMDTFAVRALLGKHGKKAPWKVYLRSGLVAFGIMAVLPAGRVGGEVARAALLGPYVGGARAGAAAARVNAVALLANALISIPCFIAIAHVVGPTDKLSLAVLANCVGTAFLSIGVLIVTKRASVGGFLSKRFRSMVHWGPAFDEALHEMPAVPYRAIFLCFLGRAIQTVQYAIILHAVGGALTPMSGLVAQGIHLVGAMAGDMVPNQVGFNEGAYLLFSGALGLGDPARAVTVALLGRVSLNIVAAVCFLTTALWKRNAAPAPAPAA